jgi:hypothetical protein
VDQTGFVPAILTGMRSICTVHGTKHLFEGMRDRPNLFPFLIMDLQGRGEVRALRDELKHFTFLSHLTRIMGSLDEEIIADMFLGEVYHNMTVRRFWRTSIKSAFE